MTVVVDAEEQSGQKVFVEKTQIVDKSGGMSLLQHGTRKFVCDGGRLQILSDFTDNKVDGKPNTSDQKLRSPAIFMAEPAALAKPGSKWSYTFNITFQKPGEPTETLPESTTRNFEAQGTETIKVPAGEFKALKVAWRVNQAQGADYYVPGIGLVKRESGEGTSWVLKEYSGVRPAE